MNKYVCPLGLTHDRPTNNGYVSGNGVLYTAEKFINGGAVLSYVRDAVESLFYISNSHIIRLRTFRYRNNLKLDSLDNIIGFRLMNIDIGLNKTGWYFNSVRAQDYSWWRWFKDSLVVWWKSRKLEGSDKRNYWWENGYMGVHKTSSIVLPQYRYFFGAHTWYYKVLFLIHCYVMSKSDNTSAKKLCINMMEFVSMDDLCKKWFDKLQVFSDYYPSDHPVLELVRSQYE